MGSVVGASVLSVEDRIARAVLNVPPGAIIENLVYSPAFRPLTVGTLLPMLGVMGSFDEVERSLELDPMVDLVRWAIEPIDPFALSHELPVDRILFQPAALDEVAWRPATDSLLAAAQATHVTRYDPAAHGMLEVLDQSSAWQPPYDPPLVPRDVEIPVTNPIAAIHDEITTWLTRP
jgi:hypothetical protein